MTQVMKRTAASLLFLLILAAAVVIAASAQQQIPAPTANLKPQPEAASRRVAEQLYLQLREVPLDPARVYHIRDASLDRDRLHITLEDGTIGFTSDVNGRVTGAFFEGEGEVLLVPPDQAERASMMLFTGAAILEEQINTAYFRFNDDTFADLRPDLRPSQQEGKDFVAQWNPTARNLAQGDALRLFMSFSRLLPIGESPSSPSAFTPRDRLLHARVQGKKLGIFDVYYDSTSPEQVAVAQAKSVEGVSYYNVWTSFSAQTSGQGPEGTSEEVSIAGYQIRAEVNPPRTLEADARVEIAILRGGSRALVFELSRYLKVKQVKADGVSIEIIQNQALEGTELARRGNDLVALVFPAPLQTGQKLKLDFSYSGEVLSEAGGGLLYVGARGTWYPNRGMALADFDVEFHYPAGWTLLATGKRVSATVPEAGTSSNIRGEQVSHWITARPIPLAGFNLGRYEKASAQANSTLVETYAAAGVERGFPQSQPRKEAEIGPLPPFPQPPTRPVLVTRPSPSPARNAQKVASGAAHAIEFYAQRYGPFPYSSLEITQMPGLLSQGWPGLVFLSSHAFLSPEERAGLHLNKVNEILDQQVTAHEVAHQWWGDLVFWHSYRDQWIFEGLANYCSLMMLERENPAAFQLVLEKYREDLLQENKSGAVLKDAGPVTLGTRLSSSEFPDGYEAISYGRGTWLFHMLRHMLNDSEASDRKLDSSSDLSDADPFTRALRRVRERYAEKPMTTLELIQAFAEELPPSVRYEGKKSLVWFYDGWVNGTAMPRFHLQGLKFVPSGNRTLVNGTILQKDAAKELVTSVPIYGVLPGNRRVFVGRVFADGPESSFRLTGPAGIGRLVIDPNQTVLSGSR